MTLRSLVRQALAALSGIRREQYRQTEMLTELLDEVRAPYPSGTVTINVGPVSEINAEVLVKLSQALIEPLPDLSKRKAQP